MSSIKHLFIIDPWENLNAELDTSLELMNKLSLLGQEVFAATQDQLSWDKDDPSAFAYSEKVEFSAENPLPKVKPKVKVFLRDFASIHMRKDPPYDLKYVETTWLLSSISKSEPTRVINEPKVLRDFNEKLLIYQFPQFCRPALLSHSTEDILKFVAERGQGVGIIKPLDLFGGRGVVKIDLKEMGMAGARSQIEATTDSGTSMRLVQPFDKHVFAGEVRAFTAFGQPLAWCLKKPAPGSFLANTRAGATLHSYVPTTSELDAVSEIAQAMLAKGAPFLGFDLIGGYVSEINVTSPRLLAAKGDSRDYMGEIAKELLNWLGEKR